MILNEYMIFAVVIVAAFLGLKGASFVGWLIDRAVPDSIFSNVIPTEDLRASYKRHRRRY